MHASATCRGMHTLEGARRLEAAGGEGTGLYSHRFKREFFSYGCANIKDAMPERAQR